MNQGSHHTEAQSTKEHALLTASLSDFSDRLPPMLVKELRQGMRARTFVAVFLGLQCFLGIVMLFATSASSLGGTGMMISRIIFLFFALAVLVVQPLRAMNSLHAEIKSTTIDMMVLTRLTARRIVSGKWASIVAQTILLFISIIPYLILRYFFGGMDLLAELLALTSIAIISAILTAINMGLSANSSLLVRGFLPLAIAFVMFSLTMTMLGGFEEMILFFNLDTRQNQWIYLCSLLGSLYFAWNAFHMGIMSLAPLSENHSSLNRLICLVSFLLMSLLLYLSGADATVVPFLLGMIVFPCVLLSLTEKDALMPRVVYPFVKRGWLARLIGSFLYPCWTSGIYFTCLMVIFLLISGIRANQFWPGGSFDLESSIYLSSFVGSVLFPACLLALCHKRISNRLGFYMAILISSFVFMLVIVTITNSTDMEQGLWLFCWLPPVYLYMANQSKFDDHVVFLICQGFTALYLLALLVHAWLHRKTIRCAIDECHREETEQDPKIMSAIASDTDLAN